MLPDTRHTRAPRNSMDLRIVAHAKGPVSADLGRVRRAVAEALRAQGLTVPTDAQVLVEGKLG